MLTTQIAIAIFAVLALLIGGIAFFLLRKTRFKFTVLILAGVVAFFVYSVVIPHVFVLDDELENRYEEYVALYSFNFTFKNGETAEVPVKGKAIIINNNDDKRVFRIDYYSTSSRAPAPRSQWLQPYTATATDHRVDYVYQDSPQTIRTKSSSTSRGVIADRR